VSELGTTTVDDLYELRALLHSSPDASSIHEIGVREVVRGPGALRSLTQVLARLGADQHAPVCVLSDNTPKRCRTTDVLDSVLDALGAIRRVTTIRLAPQPGASLVLADEATVAGATESVRMSASTALVSVGSGTIVDIAKVVARELSITHVVVQTAASVNGYADDQSVLLINGVKRTTPSRWPDALVIDPEVIAEAPLAMTRAGLGDQLSMYSAAADWYLSNAVGFDDSYSDTIVTTMRHDVDDLVAASLELGQGDPAAIGLLTSCLTAGGLAMGAAGRTAPSSGSEHLISHVLEMHADAAGQPSASHGSQVGAASVLAALIWARVRQRLRDTDAHISPANLATREHVLAAFADLDATGAAARECWKDYERKSTWILRHLDDIQRAVHKWREHDEVFEGLLRPPDYVAGSLRMARAPVDFAQLDPAPEPEVVRWALTNCHLMRDRFTVIDLAQLLGAWGPSDVSQLLDQQAALSR
jgi:glycerol-1-phosphate dehydrogenase [NAD(P)+]